MAQPLARPLLALIAAAFATTAGNTAQADSARGLTLHNQLCLVCHANPGSTGGLSIQAGAGQPAVIRNALVTNPEMQFMRDLLSATDIVDISEYLTIRFSAAPPPPPPPSPPAASNTLVEYFHEGFGHYFITGLADEIDKLERGVIAGWKATGLTFKVSSTGTAGTLAVCRFFSASFAPKSSHFYTVTECASLKANPNWQFEAEVFGMQFPDSLGGCTADTIPLYRLYNDGLSGAPNHRYTTSLSVRGEMLARGFIAEGTGIGVTGCVPQ